MFIIENEIVDEKLLSGFKDALADATEIMPHGGIPNWITEMDEAARSDREVFLAAFFGRKLESHREAYLFTFGWIACGLLEVR